MTRLLTFRVQIAASVLVLGLIGLTLAGATWAGAVAVAGLAGLAMAWASGRERQPELIPVKVRSDDRRRR
jgi:hydrogenase/urease accessory protein HupE